MPPRARRTGRTGRGPAISPATSSGNRPRRTGLGAAFGYAFAGLRAAWSTQPNVRIHAAIVVLIVAAGILLRLPAAAWAILALAVGLVVVAELLNTALEAVVDLVSPDDHPLAKQAKDVAAAAVLIAALTAAVTGAFVTAWALWRS